MRKFFKKKYRICTADHGLYEIQVWRFAWLEFWWTHYSYEATKEAAIESIARYEASDVFKPKVVWP